MEENDINEKKENKYKPLNIFFYFKKESDIIIEIKKLLNTMTDKFTIKGEFDQTSLLNELSYYLGNKDKDRGKIKKKETQNVIISSSSFEESKDLLIKFIKKFEKGIVKNDDHPFFIFLKDEKDNNYDIRQLILDINKFQEKINNTRKLDSRNISLENKETTLEKIENIFNYFNENDEKNIYFNNNVNYNISYTINILTIGRRGSGKSTLINRLLGEKKAYAQKNAKTLNTKEYYHKYYPIKFIDSSGFEIGTLSQIKNVTDFLEKNNLNYENIFKKIHFIFYLFKSNDKFEDIELKIIKQLSSFNIDIIFIMTNMTNEDDEESSKSSFEDILKENNFTEGEINKIINNTFCLDLLDINYSIVLSDILSNLSDKIEKYKKSNDFIIESINNFHFLDDNEDNEDNEDNVKNKDFSETERILTNVENEEGILVKKLPKSPNNLIEIIKEAIKDNIFFIDFETDRKRKYNLALKIVDSYKKSAFWWGFIPIPILDWYLSKLSRERMIKEIRKIYEIVFENRIEKEMNEEYKYFIYDASSIAKPLPIFYFDPPFTSAKSNENKTLIIGEGIVNELDTEYAKIYIIDKYFDLAKKLNKNFDMFKEFSMLFKENFWYDIKILQNNKESSNESK